MSPSARVAAPALQGPGGCHVTASGRATHATSTGLPCVVVAGTWSCNRRRRWALPRGRARGRGWVTGDEVLAGIAPPPSGVGPARPTRSTRCPSLSFRLGPSCSWLGVSPAARCASRARAHAALPSSPLPSSWRWHFESEVRPPPPRLEPLDCLHKPPGASRDPTRVRDQGPQQTRAPLCPASQRTASGGWFMGPCRSVLLSLAKSLCPFSHPYVWGSTCHTDISHASNLTFITSKSGPVN